MTVEAVVAAIQAASEPPPAPPDDRKLAEEPRNDLGNGRRLIDRYGHDLIDVAAAGWHVWNGRRWRPSVGQHGGPGPEALRLAHDTAKMIAAEAAAITAEAPPLPAAAEDKSQAAQELRAQHRTILAKAAAHRSFGIVSGNIGKIEGMLKAAAPYLRRTPDQLDAGPLLLNCENGTLDLGVSPPVLRPHARGDLITHLAPVAYDPEAGCDTWRNFLARILPDPDLRLFLQTWFGYCLSALTVEQRLVLAYGTGANGKTVLMNAVAHVLGDYAATVPIETFLHQGRRGGGDATPDLARLPGRRLVVAAEPETGARLAESMVKAATGGEAIAVRHLYENQFEFLPSFKLMISANVKPSIRGQDEGIWRRVLLLPFNVFIPEAERDRHLLDRLKAEAAGILNWMLDGWMVYRERGLVVPDKVLAATELYRSESDSVREFLAGCTVLSPTGEITAKHLHRVYCAWAAANALEPLTGAAFGRRMTALGIERRKVGVKIYVGLDLSADGLRFLDELSSRGGAGDGSDDAGAG